MSPPRLPSLRERLRMALAEDRVADDITTARTVPPRQMGSARLIARERGVIAGLRVFAMVFQLVNRRIDVAAAVTDGDRVRPGQTLARLRGPLGAILRGERLALNFTCHLSGVATLTAQCVAATRGTRTVILDTRKTTPLWRDLEREAVRAGGGVNHRFDLAEIILVKNNHVDAAGGVTRALRRVFAPPRPRRRIIVEVRNLRELREALVFPVDVIMLDNMTQAQVARAVEITAGRTLLEASGGLEPRKIAPLARLGVDRISIGRLTHSASALDLSLRCERTG